MVRRRQGDTCIQKPSHNTTNITQLSLVVRLLYHQGPIKWDGFDIRTAHSKRAVGGVLERLKKQYVTAAGESVAGIKEDKFVDGKVKAKKGKKSAKEAVTRAEEEEDVETADTPVEKKKRERKPSKKAAEAGSSEPAESKTPAPEASTETKSKKRSRSKTSGADSKGKKVKTEVEA